MSVIRLFPVVHIISACILYVCVRVLYLGYGSYRIILYHIVSSYHMPFVLDESCVI